MPNEAKKNSNEIKVNEIIIKISNYTELALGVVSIAEKINFRKK
jgi:hypothetical protein